MKTTLAIIAACLGAAFLSTSCLTGRAVAYSGVYDFPNTITTAGFTYVKKGVEASYEVTDIFPSKLERAEIIGKLNIAHDAYDQLVRAAGGLEENQRFVNVVVEASFVQIIGSGAKLYLVVHMYADVIQFGGGAAPAPEASRGAPAGPAATSAVLELIERSVARAVDAHLSSTAS